MDILYILGKGSRWNNQELKYSLRSIDKYGINVDKVVIVGEKPNFINDKVIHIPCKDVGNNKHSKILNKILTAVDSGLLSDHFLISSDDHFYIKETDFDKLPIYYKNEVISGNTKSEYSRSLLQTKLFLEKNNLPIYLTNPHCNTHFDVNIYNKYKQLFDLGCQLPDGLETNCLMGNLLIKEGSDFKRYRDIKIEKFKNHKLLLNKIKDSECFSIYDSAIGCGIGNYLQELFPDKCKYEK